MGLAAPYHLSFHEPKILIFKRCFRPWQGTIVREYRAYVIGPDGHISHRVDMLCETEEGAKELWTLDCPIATFTPDRS
jgi:hypothetical protein